MMRTIIGILKKLTTEIMVVKLTDELKVKAYFDSMVGLIAGLTHVVYIDADQDTQVEVSQFYGNVRTNGGLVLFVGLYDGMTDMAGQKDNYEFVFSLSVLKQVQDKMTVTMLTLRKDTRECLLNILGKIAIDEQDSMEHEDELEWEWKRSDERFIPSGEMGNAKAFGFTTGIELLVDVSKAMYKNL